MIALPGLTIPTRRTVEALKTLRAFGLFVRDGLLPNNFPDSDAPPHYNTVDATLWMFNTLDTLVQATGDMSVARDLYPTLVEIIERHVEGTRFGIGVDPSDGLLRAGEEGVQLTWMDAKAGDWVVTPRIGKPVEINALWIKALRVMMRLQASLGVGAEPSPDFRGLARQAQESFRERFWYEEGGYLYDVVDGPEGDDRSLRPNQVIALAVGPMLVSKPRAGRVLGSVRRHLLTPYGLRTLSPEDPRYIGKYEGDRVERDGAYHQGTVWTWLLGPYFDAVLAVEGEEAYRGELKRIMPALREHLADAGLGTISEIFDAEAPYAPKGCIAQAWSVAEVLRHVMA